MREKQSALTNKKENISDLFDPPTNNLKKKINFTAELGNYVLFQTYFVFKQQKQKNLLIFSFRGLHFFSFQIPWGIFSGAFKL